jgi:HAD superfamily hydrolase (TIGR01509 family)
MSTAVIFDFDGVLIDSEGLQYKSYLEVLSRYGVWVSLVEYCEYWIAAGCGPEHAVEKYGLPITAEQLRDQKNPVYHKILRQGVTLMPGVVAALSRIGQVFPLALATNSNRTDVGYALEHFDLARHFAVVVTRDDYEHPKPEPDAFLTAASRLAVPPERCVVIEDAHKGIVAAKRAGAKVIAVPNEYTRTNDFSSADAVLRGLEGLDVELIERLVGRPAGTHAVRGGREGLS